MRCDALDDELERLYGPAIRRLLAAEGGLKERLKEWDEGGAMSDDSDVVSRLEAMWTRAERRQEDTIERLQAENCRLRAALHQFADASNWIEPAKHPDDGSMTWDWVGEADSPVEFAQKALKGNE